jgi:hypothetical protein
VATLAMNARQPRALYRSLEHRSCVREFFARLPKVHFGQREDGIPEGKHAPLAVARPMCTKQFTDAFVQSFLLSI